MPKIVDKAAKRAAIARQAMALFARNGFEKTPIRAIAAAAGMGKGTFYDYFADKEDILNEIVQLVFADWTKIMLSKITATDDPLEQLNLLVQEGAGLGDAFEQLMVLYVDAWRRSVDQSGSGEFVRTLRALLIQSKTAVTGIVVQAQKRGLVRNDLDAAALAGALIALIDGLSLHHMLFKSDFDAEGVSRTVTAALMDGIRP
jgi:AcrR family transcriptional regulator